MGVRKLPPNEQVVAWYQSGKSCPEIAEMCGVSKVTVDSCLRRIGEPLRSVQEAARLRTESGRVNPTRYWLGKKQPTEMVERRVSKIRGERHWLWKGGISDRREYRQVIQKEQCERCGSRDRLLIHHRNDDHYDNSPENLGVLCLSCHSSIHKKAYWDAVHAGQRPTRGNAPNNWTRHKVKSAPGARKGGA